jgi:hypothetical protein
MPLRKSNRGGGGGSGGGEDGSDLKKTIRNRNYKYMHGLSKAQEYESRRAVSQLRWNITLKIILCSRGYPSFMHRLAYENEKEYDFVLSIERLESTSSVCHYLACFAGPG